LPNRHAHEGKRHDGPPSHGIDIGDGIGGRNRAEVKGVIDDGHEEVRGGDQGLCIIELVDRCIVCGADTDQQLGGYCHRRRVFENLREYARCNLAAAAPSMRERGKPWLGDGLVCHRRLFLM
jgi:hypothetical protein